MLDIKRRLCYTEIREKIDSNFKKTKNNTKYKIECKHKNRNNFNNTHGTKSKNKKEVLINELTKKEIIFNIVLSGFIIIVISYLFYNSIKYSLLVLILAPKIIKILNEKNINKKKKHNLQEFKEFCICIANLMVAGYSLEQAIENSYFELNKLFGEKSFICSNIKIICNKMKINIPIEKCLKEFASTTDLEDVVFFSEVVSIAKLSGGDIISLIKTLANNISEKYETEREIEKIINEKKYESSVMCLMPFFMIIYMRLTSPNMINIMYNTLIGNVIMSLCLLMYVAAFLLNQRIVNIKV